MEPHGLELVGEPIPLQREHGAYLLVEAKAFTDLPGDVAVAADAAQRDALWRLREHHTDAIARQPGPPAHKLDVMLPLDHLAAFRTELSRVPADIVLFGHLAVGNLHVNVLDGSDELDDTILRLVAGHGGSIAAEHGVGTAKTRWLPLTTDIEPLRAVKDALDPHGILNPGVILPAR
jgi:FAD/FMN-containing dehydrogenase